MHDRAKILLLSALLRATTILASIDSPEGVSSRWMQILPDPGKIPNYNRFQLFHDILIEDDRHSLALLRWHDLTEYHPTRCNVTIETHSLDGGISRKTCKVYPPPDDDNKWAFPESVTYLSRDRVLLTWREAHKTQGLRMTSQVIFMDKCRTSEYINVETYVGLSVLVHMVVRHDTSFDVIFSNAKVCPTSYYCKLSFNHDGEQLSRRGEALSTPIRGYDEASLTIVHAYPMNYNSRAGTVLVGNQAEGLVASEVYSPISGWTSADGLFYKNHWYSNSSGYATICWQLYRSTEFRCKWLDRPTTLAHRVLSLSMQKQYVRIAGIHNTPDGRILLLMPGYEVGTTFFVDEASWNRGCKRLATVPYTHGLIKRVEMSMEKRTGRACFSFVTKKTVSGNPRHYPITDTYQFTTKCLRNLLDGPSKLITCGQGYL